MMMICKVITACRGNCLQLVVGKTTAEMPPRSHERVMEHIIRIIHLINLEYGLQAPFIEACVVRDQGQALDLRGYLFPYGREDRRIVSVLRPQTVDLPAKPLVVLRLRMDKAVERIHYLPATDDDHPHAAHAAGALVRRLEILCWGDSYVGWPL